MPSFSSSPLFLDQLFYELILFSAAGYLIIGIDEVAVDLMWLGLMIRKRRDGDRGSRVIAVDSLPLKSDPNWFAICIPARDESAVIGQMLAGALRSYSGQQVHIFVGCYPDDPQTIRIARQFQGDSLSVVVLGHSGPSTKAECLNTIYLAIPEHERLSGRHYAGIVLHDAEDVISPHEIAVFDAFIDQYGMIQLPVIPLQDRDSRWISGHYCDEFAEAHMKRMVVRQALGAALPSAGVGCMIRRDALDALAALGGGRPFAEDSVTEDYEVGLKIAEFGLRTGFLRIASPDRFGVVATTAHFPSAPRDSLRQKARWVSGITLSAWDRMSWGRGWKEKWMRLRDRASLLSAIVSAAGYVALILGATLLAGWQSAIWRSTLFDQMILGLVGFNGFVLLWRVIFRFGFTAYIYGPGEAVWSVPRILVSNLIAIASACLAASVYVEGRRKGKVRWDKTRHKFPDANTPE